MNHAMILSLLTGVVLVLLSVGVFFLIPRRPGRFELFVVHFLFGIFLISDLESVRILLLSLLSASLIHFILAFSEVFEESPRRKLLFILPYLVGILLFGIFYKTHQSSIVMIYFGVSLILVVGLLANFLRQPHSEFDRLLGRCLLIGMILGIFPSFLAAPLALLLPLTLLAGIIPFRRKYRENYLIQSEKRVTFGNMLAGLAHEINNPMTFISSNISPLRKGLQFLKDSWPGVPDAKVSDKFQKLSQLADDMEEGVTRAQQLIQSIRTLPYEKKEPKEEVDLNRVIDQSINLLSHKWKERLRIEKRFEDIPKIRGSSGELGQVFTNLIGNACEATPDRGRVDVSTHKRMNGVQVRIRDSGKGIPPDQIGRIFDPFFTTKGDQGGTGLGLSITLQLVKNHRGTIEVKSDVGKGTEFLVFLPY